MNFLTPQTVTAFQGALMPIALQQARVQLAAAALSALILKSPPMLPGHMQHELAAQTAAHFADATMAALGLTQ